MELEMTELEIMKSLEKIMTIKNAAFLGNRHFELNRRFEKNKCFVDAVLKNQDESFYYPVETRMDCLESSLSNEQGSLLLLDFIDAYFEEFFKESESVYLPIDWQTYQMDGYSFDVKGQILNKKLEEEADRLLN